MTMAGTKEDQAHEAFEVIEHSDAFGDQCQEAATATALAELEKKVRKMEQRLEEEMAKTKVCINELCVAIL